MKYFAFVVLVFVAVAIVSAQEEYRVENCIDIRKPGNVCFGVKCNKKSNAIELIRCPHFYGCKEDSEPVVLRALNGSKPFPDCCAWTVCKFKSNAI